MSELLLVDNNKQLATSLAKSLESEGHSVCIVRDEKSARAELKRQNYKLIILDLNFGPTDGLNLLEQLRAEGLATPVLVLSARTGVTDRIKSLNLGADDYVVKPFSFQELAARANAILRRKVDPELEILRVEDLELNPRDRKVTRGDREINLSPKEFELLNLLMRRAGNTVSRQDLLDKAWGLQPETDSNLVDVYVNYLRNKIDFPHEEKLISTVHGVGYRLGRRISKTDIPLWAIEEVEISNKTHFYISHSSPDARFAIDMAKNLRKQGFAAWLDVEQLAPGQSWQDEVNNAIRNSKIFLILLSHSMQIDDRVSHEWRRLLQSTWNDPSKRIIPVLLDPIVLPGFLKGLPCITSEPGSRDASVIAQSLVGLLSAKETELSRFSDFAKQSEMNERKTRFDLFNSAIVAMEQSLDKD